MKFRIPSSAIALIVAALTISAQAYAQELPSGTRSPAIGTRHPTPDTRSLKFIPNRGQIADQFGKPMPEVLYTLDGHGVKFYFTKNSMHYVFSKATGTSAFSKSTGTPAFSRRGQGVVDPGRDTLSLYRVDAHFLGANPDVTITAEDTASNFTNYYLAQCPNGITHVPAFHRIIYHDLYPHIDMMVRGGATMEYDFIVHPGGNPNQIAILYDHADSLALKASGALWFVTPYGEMSEEKPSSYQALGETGRHSIASRFLLTGNTLRFAVGTYDPSHELIIDPPRLWATYYGGIDFDLASNVAVGNDQSIYLGGWAMSSNNIATTGSFKTTRTGGTDAFVAKFDENGNRLWATYYGGSADEQSNGLCVDPKGSVYLCGVTNSTSGIASSGAYQTSYGGGNLDAFLVKFDSSGSRLWGTYFGGSDVEDENGYIDLVATDPWGNVFLGGSTKSTTGIATPGAYQTALAGNLDAFVAKFDSLGNIIWSTYYGGSGDENPESLATDSIGSVILVGVTSSTAGIATAGAFQTSLSGGSGDGFIAKFDSAGSPLWATYFGGPSTDNIESVACDETGNVFVTGNTYSTSGIASAGAYQATLAGSEDALIAEFSTSGVRQWSTYFGGDSATWGSGIALIGGRLYVTGNTFSTYGIATADGFQATLAGKADGFVEKFSTSGSRIWGTYYGGPNIDATLSITSDSKGNPIFAGQTLSTAGIATNGSFQPTSGGYWDGFLVKLCDYVGPHIESNRDTVCEDGEDSLWIEGNYSNTQWFDSSAHLATIDGFLKWALPTPLPVGTHRFSLTASNGDCMGNSDTLTIVVNPLPHVNAGGNKSICYGNNTSIGGTATLGQAPYTYHWFPSAGLSDTTQPVVIASPRNSTIYYVSVTDKDGCQAFDSVLVTVNPLPLAPVLRDTSTCLGTPVVIGGVASGGHAPYSYYWSPPDGLDNRTKVTPSATPGSTTRYTVIVTDSNGCQVTASQNVRVFALPVPVIAADTTVVYCATDSALLDAGSGYAMFLWSNGKSGQVIHAGAGTYTVTVTDSNGCSGTSAPVTITQVAPPSAVVSGPTSECPNSVTGYRSEDNGISSYLWSLPSGGTIQSGQGTDSLTVDWTTPGTWKLSIAETMAHGGCQRDTTISVTITDSLQPAITQTGPSTMCTGDTLRLAADAGYNSYLWSTGETMPSIEVTKTGDYFVHVTNASGCSGTSSAIQVTVLADSVPRPVLAAANTTICAGDSIALTTTLSYPDYSWSTGATSDSIFVSKAGTYSVTVSNADGCTGTSAPMTFVVQPLPRVQLAANGPTTFCAGDSVTLEATQGYRHSWWNNGTSLPDTAADLIVKTSGSYAVTATDAAGCDSTSPPVSVTVEPLPVVSITGPASICIGGWAGYRIQPLAGSSIAWQIDPATLGSISSGQGSDTITVQWGNQASGTLTVAVTDAAGCTGKATMPIAIDSHLTPVVTPVGPLAFCPGDRMTLDAGAGYASYQWSKDGNTISGANGETLIVSQAGDYSVFVTGASGCSGSSKGTVVTVYPVPTKPIITRNGKQLSSSAAASYAWSFEGTPILGDSLQTISPAQDGSYSVTITDVNGCIATSDPLNFTNFGSVTVMLPAAFRANPGDHISIPVTLVNPTNVIESGATTYAGSVSFNATTLAPQGPLGTVSGTVRTIPISGTLPSALSSGMTLQLLDFIATLGTDTCTSLIIDTFYFPNANIAVTKEDGDFCLSGVCMDGGRARLIDPNVRVSLSEVHPNPANSSVEIDYHLGEEGPTKLCLQDMLGRTALIIRDEWMKPGGYSDNLNVAMLPSGAYRLVLRTPSDLLTKRMEVMK